MNSLYEKQVGYTLRAIRKKQGYTQDQIAAQLQLYGCNMSRSALAKIETGHRHIYIDEVKALCIIFNISSEEILVDASVSEEK